MKLNAAVGLLAILAAPLAAEDLVFRSVNPCVIFDTRPAFGGTGAFEAEEERHFLIVGSTGLFAAQGGTPGGCGVPGYAGERAVAKAVFINYIAIDALGAGQIKAWAAEKSEPPQGALVNYQALIPPMNNSNGVVTELGQNFEGNDIRVRARSAGTHVRGVVLGYFLEAPPLIEKRVAVGWHGQTFATGLAPSGVASDGSHVWVVNKNANNVMKFRAGDGARVGTFPVPSQPQGIAFDGTNMWIASISGSVTKLRVSDGQNLGSFAIPGVNPSALAFDGEYIWVTKQGSNNVTKLRASDGLIINTYAVGLQPIAVLFDGVNIWIANFAGDTVNRIRLSDGAITQTVTVTDPSGLAFDGVNLWVTNYGTDAVTRLRASDGFNLGSVPAGDGPLALAFDGSNMWVANQLGHTVTKLRGSDGALFGTFPVQQNPSGIAVDGASVWVTNFVSNTVSKL